MRNRTADGDYIKLNEIIKEFVKLDNSPKPVRVALFYMVIDDLKYERLPNNYMESKPMRELRLRYERGKGQPKEELKMYEYFNRKFSKEIQETRRKLKELRNVGWKRR